MKLHQLSTLIALVDAGSIRGAARALGLTQPALTSRIAELEHEIGATLVNRTAHGTTLTGIGRALLVHARIIDNHVRRAEEEIAQLSNRGVASVAIGVSPLAALEIVAPLLEPLQQYDSNAHLRVTEGQFQEMSVALREGALDLVIAPIPLVKQGSKTFHFEELVAYPMHVVARADHPLKKCAKLADLSGAKWVVGAATNSKRSTLEELYLEYGLAKPTIAVHADAITLVQASIAASDLLGLLPRPLFDGWPQKISALPIVDAIRPLRLGLITLAGTPLTPIAERFVGLVRERARQVAKVLASQRQQ
ncbi:MAG: LysR substrate-binding domain-containing protein [Burkholderiaceae bacterium]|nr:LysR substrate-binding domain-containing protein [Burkholderiaceae bacterium]